MGMKITLHFGYTVDNRVIWYRMRDTKRDKSIVSWGYAGINEFDTADYRQPVDCFPDNVTEFARSTKYEFTLSQAYAGETRHNLQVTMHTDRSDVDRCHTLSSGIRYGCSLHDFFFGNGVFNWRVVSAEPC